MEINKVIIPTEFNTHFLPLSKSICSQMLSLYEKPVIHYALEDSAQAAFKNVFFISDDLRRLTNDYCASNDNLMQFLKEQNREEQLNDLTSLLKNLNFTYIEHHDKLGLGHALLSASHCLQKEYFGIALPHDIVIQKTSIFEQLARLARQEKCSVVAVQEVPFDVASSYGMISIKKQLSTQLFQVGHIVDKPAPAKSPSNLAVVGRYIMSSKLITALDDTLQNSIKNTLSLHDGINTMIQQGEKVIAVKIQGLRYDTSTPLGWMKAVIGLGLQHKYYAPHLKKFLQELETTDSYCYNPYKNIHHTV